MDTLQVILLVVALVTALLAVLEIFQTNGRTALGWAALALAALILLPQIL